MRLRLAYLEAALALAVAWAMVFVVPVRWTLPLFGTARKSVDDASSSQPLSPAEMARARGVAVLLNRMDRRLPWHNTCLVRALAGRMMLARRGIRGGVVRFGVGFEGGKLAAHAWLILADVTLLGGAEAGDFKPLADLT
ncbi:lasso peptide biosynthesis B2 protein [Radicibacter daui]|uniref:lasso peptide biosynthesis B2 protein n=1 Tax=Radicibacter daui TaxID=3064829 RepID=UPI004046BC7F